MRRSTHSRSSTVRVRFVASEVTTIFTRALYVAVRLRLLLLGSGRKLGAHIYYAFAITTNLLVLRWALASTRYKRIKLVDGAGKKTRRLLFVLIRFWL